MSVTRLLQEIRTAWMDRVSHRLARGEGVRENFLEQLNRFYELIQHAVDTGDPAWLDPLLDDWTRAQTASDPGEGESSLASLITQIILLTYETCQELLPTDQALEALGAFLPLLTYAYEQTAWRETQIKLSQMKEALQEAQAELERLDRSKSNFISVAAHELKTPLTLIEGYAAMIRELYPKGDQQSQAILLLKGIFNGTERLREIVDDMIDVSLIDNNLLSLNFQPVWLNRLFEILTRDLAGIIAERKQRLRVNRFPGCDEMTYGDPERLYQAFRNLLSNAVKFTPDGGDIVVDGRKLPGFIEVTVRDTGIGIAPEDHSRIFEKFGQLGNVQFHSSSKSQFKGGGPGLGLPIAKGIIEAHGGAIWVESEAYDEVENPGSTFHVLLPVYTGPPDDKSAKLFAALGEASPQASAESAPNPTGR